MKNISTQKILIFFLLISLVLVGMLEFVYADASELFYGGSKLADMTTNLCLAYISGYFFYCITSVLPKKIEREHIKEHLAHLISRVLFHILFILQDSVNSKIPQQHLKIKSLSEEAFKDAAKGVYMDNNISPLRASKHGRPMRVGEAVTGNIQDLQDTINEIFKYSPYVETELISLISSATRNSLNESWININNMVPLQLGNIVLVAERTDNSGFAKSLLEYHLLYKKIETIFVTNYKNTIAAQKHIENIKAIKNS